MDSTLLNQIYLDNTLGAWLFALGITLAFYIVVRMIRWVGGRRFALLAHRTGTDLDDQLAHLFHQTKMILVVVVAIYLGSTSLRMSAEARAWLGMLALLAGLIQVAVWGDSLITYGLTRYQKKQSQITGEQTTTLRAVSFVIRLALFSVIAVLALDNIPGVEVSSLIASLGIGGIAVALALQNILADLFASLSIALDKPFVIGDFISIDTFKGTVENIGLKTTRVRSISGEQLVFSNSDLLSSRIRNYKRMTERRIVFKLGVTYQTPLEQMKQIPQIIRAAIEAQTPTRFDRAHFTDFGDFSLNFEAVYYLIPPDYLIYLDAQQAINLILMERFAEQGIEFAYPTQTIFVEPPSAPTVPD